MAAQRQPRPEPQRPERTALRLVAPTADASGRAALRPELAGPAFHQGLRWGIAVSTLGFWLPVATALYVWLA